MAVRRGLEEEHRPDEPGPAPFPFQQPEFPGHRKASTSPPPRTRQMRAPSSSTTPSTYPPTPDHPAAAPEPEPRPNRSYISGTIFTGGLNCVTHGHVMECSADSSQAVAKSTGMVCKMKGCDGVGFLKGSKLPCECGFMICKECFMECIGGGSQCPGCKGPFSTTSDEDESGSETEDQALPLTLMAKFVAGRRLSMVQSMKVPNKPSDFDHNRWLSETKGTYGYGNAVWPKDGRGDGGGFKGFEEPPDFRGKCRRRLTRKAGVSQAIISPYRLLIIIRLVALGFFLMWRIRHPNHEAMWLRGTRSGLHFRGFSTSFQSFVLSTEPPIFRFSRSALNCQVVRNPKGRSDLPGVYVFVSTADPDKEPPLVTTNTILSILAVDYPVEKLACYLSDDGGSLLTFEALAETASFARIWVPFCRKHDVEPRNPEAYFGQKRDFLKNKVRLDFVRERRKVKREYDEVKVRINALPELIRRRSDAYNAHEELRAKKQEEMGGNNISEPLKFVRATWMSDGSYWPWTWLSADVDHSRGDHAGIIQNRSLALKKRPGNLINTTGVDVPTADASLHLS